MNTREEENVNEKNRSNLESYRKKKFLTRQQLSEISGVSIKAIQSYEQGIRDINKAAGETIYHLAKALDCNMENLLELNGRRTSKYYTPIQKVVSDIKVLDSKYDMKNKICRNTRREEYE